jgi:spore coat polysaccharide biosynthesis protein SpsF
MKIIAVTQARYGSTRLPAKILRKVGDLTLLDVHIHRILCSQLITKLKVATTNEEGSDKIVEIANKYGVECYRGSVNNVLERFYNCVEDENPDYIVRLTSDCPLIDPQLIDGIINKCIKSDYDYVSNTLIPTYPDGVDVEVFKFSALKMAVEKATLKSDKEHVTPYIWRNSNVKGGAIFSSFNYTNSEDYSNYRITVDTIEDFDVVKILIETLGIDKHWSEYLNYLKSNTDVRNINCNHQRNEGYTKSLLND